MYLAIFNYGLQTLVREGNGSESGVGAVSALSVLRLYCSLWGASVTEPYEKETQNS